MKPLTHCNAAHRLGGLAQKVSVILYISPIFLIQLYLAKDFGGIRVSAKTVMKKMGDIIEESKTFFFGSSKNHIKQVGVCEK